MVLKQSTSNLYGKQKYFCNHVHSDPCYPAGGSSKRIQTVEVVVMAAMVPMGMDFWASRRSPERLEPAMIPEQTVEMQKLSRSRRFTHIQTQSVLKAAEYDTH